MLNWTNLNDLDLYLDNFIKKFAQVCQDLAILADEIGESHWANRFFALLILRLVMTVSLPHKNLTLPLTKLVSLAVWGRG